MNVGQELAAIDGVADGGGGVDAEHGGQMQRVCVAGEGFLELAVDAQPVKGGGLSAQLADPGGADRARAERAFAAQQEVEIGGVRPAGPAVVQPLGQQSAGEVVQRPGPSGDGDPPVAGIDVADLQGADLAGAGGVDGGQRNAQPGLRCPSGLDRAGDLAGGQRLPDRQGPGAGGDPTDRLTKITPSRLAHVNSDRSATSATSRAPPCSPSR